MKKWTSSVAKTIIAGTMVWGSAAPTWAAEVDLEARWLDGQPYVKASQLTAQLGGTGSYNASTGMYTYDQQDLSKVIEQISPSVVAIIGRPEMDEQESNTARFELSHGTGVIIREDGWIITNAHVVKGLTEMVVVTPDGKQLNATTVAMDEESDLALVRVHALGLRAAVLSSSNVSVGETVVAVGTPISFALRNSVTVGVVSGIDRSVNSTYQLLQTDAAINPGNSGGPLVNRRGEVVGINSLKFADYDIDNLGFAIPIDTVNYVIGQLMAHGYVQRPYLGAELEESWAAVVGLPSAQPLTVNYVASGSPAAKIGMQEGDTLLAIDGKSFTTLVQFNELLKRYAPGETATLRIRTGEVSKDVKVTFTTMPGASASQPASQNQGQALNIWSQAGNGRYLINGTTHTLAPAQSSQGVTMAPLELFTLAYGPSDGAWELKGNSLNATVGQTQWAMTVGSKTASLNGETIELPAAPVLVSGKPMVPYRYVAESLGMQLDYYEHSREMIISGALDEEHSFTNTSNIDRDMGKTRIGNSFYGWSLKYPSSLIFAEQGDGGAWVDFSDAAGAYWLSVAVEAHTDADLTDEELLSMLSDQAGSQVLSKEIVKDPDGNYAKITAKGYLETYQEFRAYRNEDHVYYVSLSVYEEDDFKNEIKYGALTRLMDSFELSFDPADESLKDLSTLTSTGGLEHKLDDYGLRFELPKEWTEDYYSYGGETSFSSYEDMDEQLTISVTSIAEGDTLQAWVDRNDAEFNETFHASYRELGHEVNTTISGLPAIISHYKYTFDKEQWTEVYSIYLFAGDYKYDITLSFGGWVGTERTELQVAAFVKDFIDSLQVNPEQMDSSFGKIEDIYDFVDKSKLEKVTSGEYDYTFSVPDYWEEMYNIGDGTFVSYYFMGGDFSVDVHEDVTMAELVKQLDGTEVDSLYDDGYDITVRESADTTIAGKKAKRLVLDVVDDDGAKATQTYLLIEHKGYIYAVSTMIYDAVKTPEHEQMLQDALESFTFESTK